MPNSLDLDPRGPSNGRLFICGTAFIALLCFIAAALVAESSGRFDRSVHVTAMMADVGDGLPSKSDVKFRGMLVGTVTGLTPARGSAPNMVDIALKQQFADAIPGSVTARVVPSNIFAVSSVQLVDNGPAKPLADGTTIQQDTSAETLLFQTTLTKLRELLAAIGRTPRTHNIGPLTALGQALDGRGPKLQKAAGDLLAIVGELNKVVATDTDDTTISAFVRAIQGLRDTSPTLLDALDNAVQPARTLAEKQAALNDLLARGASSAGTLQEAFDHQTDRLIDITTKMTPVVGVLADNAEQIPEIGRRLVEVSRRALDTYHPERGAGLTLKLTLALTPNRQYVRADCPHYGSLGGPSCVNAPEVPTAPQLLPALESQGFTMPDGRLSENRPNVAAPRDSITGSGESPPPPAAPPLPPEAPTPAPVRPQKAPLAGDIGPVGSVQEQAQLSRIAGGEASTATVLLLGPLVRGTTVQIPPDSGIPQ